MRALPSPVRKKLETSVVAARRAAESAARASIGGLGVFADRRPEHLDASQAALRNGLRAKWRQLGGDRELLVAECAYEQWHRLLFARFLAENDLLRHPKYKAPVTLADCEELAAELDEPDGWSVAARFASEILPGIFRLADPCVRLRLAPEGCHALEQILDGVTADVFAADDALGWVYQFWQKDKKDEVNASERKIGGADLGPVTQLFTENYMVRFLLENSLGAWWAARHPDSPLVKSFEYLRLGDDGKPAAGSFDGWPDRVAEVTVMDPCCGSGHFLVEAFSMLWQMRSEDEGSSAVDAQDAVLRDNLFGLELDPRCVQIAMFAVALQAWKAGRGWRQLPVPNIACSGIPVKAPVDEWKAIAGSEARLEATLMRLHGLFREADTLGSLIDPPVTAESSNSRTAQRSLEDVDWAEIVGPLRTVALREGQDPATSVLGHDAAGLARAADLLGRRYCLVATNPPFLGRGSQTPLLQRFVEARYAVGRQDLATVFLVRASQLALTSGAAAFVLPQNWLTLGSYEPIRRKLLGEWCLRAAANLGAGAFEAIAGEVVKPVLAVLQFDSSCESPAIMLDASSIKSATAKARALMSGTATLVTSRSQLKHPDARILFEVLSANDPLSKIASSYTGTQTGEDSRFKQFFWEQPRLAAGWVFTQSAPNSSGRGLGREHVVMWEDGAGALATSPGSTIRGRAAWGRRGLVISKVGSLYWTDFTGELFDDSAIAIIPENSSDLSAIAAYVDSPEFRLDVRRIDQKVAVTPGTMVKVPFDAEQWRKIAESKPPLAVHAAADPTQWLFEGGPELSTSPLQVGIGRLLGYRWPEQADSDDLDAFADADGIVCLPSVAGEAPATERVQQVLAAAFRDAWSPAKMNDLLEQAGSKRQNLADWLCDEFFKQHCVLFGNRPFVWHIWDGQRDGFSALVNYHRLDRKTLEKLTYTYLGQDWVERQRAEVRDEAAGAEARLSAALKLQRKLEAIIEGEKPYDIYVRWKDLHEQPVGWEPDLNDGVRLNIRPFVEAGVLRAPFNIHWRKDRGKNPDGSERHNDVHLSLAEKVGARKRAGRA
jgi:hypothetical protein